MTPLEASEPGGPEVNPIDPRTVLEPLHPASYAWALHCCGRRRDVAEDVLQDVYIRVLDGRARFDGRSSARTWLFGVIRQVAREHSRRGWLHATLLARWQRGDAEPLPAPDPHQLLEQCQRNERLRQAVQRLPRRQQAVLHLVFYQDLTIDEAAQTLAISLGSARTHFERGKRRMREFLGPRERP